MFEFLEDLVLELWPLDEIYDLLEVGGELVGFLVFGGLGLCGIIWKHYIIIFCLFSLIYCIGLS